MWDGSECTYFHENFADVSDPSFSEAGIIPMNLNNYWRYADSTWDETGNLTASGEFVMQPTKAQTMGGETWWTLNHYPIQFMYQSNDTVYNLQGDPWGCSLKNPVYVLFVEDSITMSSGIWDDVSVQVNANKVNSFETPAGIFSDCFYYKKTGYDATVLKPNIGILEWTSGFEDQSLAGRKLTLLEYHIE
jgi:hypothetical protein